MAERRSLGAAIALTPETMAFIQGGSAPRQPEPVVTQVEVATSEEPASPTVTPRPRSRPRRRAESAERSSVTTPSDHSLLGNLLVPLTTRLQPETADALRRACLEQKLDRRRPATQQEIVESAVRTWLASEGYLV